MLLFFLLFVSVSCKSLRNSIMLNLSPFLIGIKFPGEFISLRKQLTFCITTSGFPPPNDVSGTSAELHTNELDLPDLMMMMMNFIHVSMYLADANWGHNIKIK